MMPRHRGYRTVGTISNGLVGWWRLDEGTGSIAYDSSGQGNNGTLINMEAGDWVAGQLSPYALDFDGVNEYVNLGSVPIITTTQFTVCGWARIDGAGFGDDSTLFEQRSDETANNKPAILLRPDVSGDAQWGIRSSNGSYQSISTPRLNYGVMAHYCGVVTSSLIIFYREGNLVGQITKAQSGNYTTGVSRVDIARHAYVSLDRGFFNGVIDDVRLYNRPLSSDEVAAIAAGLG